MKKLNLLVVLCLLLSTSTFANQIIGFVKDQNNDPLPGVSIVVQHTAKSTVTDFDGKFVIDAISGDVLELTYIGFVSKKVKVGKSNRLSIVLEASEEILEEVVVVGYVTQKKRGLTGAVRRVSHSKAQKTNISGRALFDNEEFVNESYATINENGFQNPVLKPLSTFSIDVDAASYSNIRRFLNQGKLPPKDAVRLEEMINYFDYDYKQPDDKNPFAIHYELANCPWNTENQLLHIGLQGKELDTEAAPPSNLVFLIDVSGSMEAPNKLPLLKKAYGLLVNQLRAKDKVAIVVYAGSSGVVLPSTSGDQKKEIINAIDKLQSGGGTAGAQGLKLAYQVAEENFIEGGNNRIILATDGDFNVGQSSDADLEKLIVNHRDKGIYISVTGFGMGNYKDSKMEIIADKGNGNYNYIDTMLEAKKVFINEFGGTLFTIAKDVKIQIEFNPNLVKRYRLIGYENRLMADEDFQNDKKDAGELGAGHTVTALYEIVPVGSSKKFDTDLKYQTIDPVSKKLFNSELATVKFRYKKPNKNKSTLIELPLKNKVIGFENTSNNFQFSSAVAGFGMLLKNSDYKENLSFETIEKMAKQAKGKDENGYRAEFIKMVEMASLL
ncbi:vWA domain-containing protein [Flavicella marina]|uniref:vWA domain-containing protein n=1 Tax=Flavicella marina TaxID=1475951 RepID=UPI0012647C01|nr:VWA domain-containing protein [Flavicella marina]